MMIRSKAQFVKDLKEKDPVESPFLVKHSAVVTGKTGKPYMNLILMDESGEIEGRIWEGVESAQGQVVKDAFVWVEGKCQLYQGRRQVVVNKAQILREDEVEMARYFPKSNLDSDALYQKLAHWISTMEDPFYRALVEKVFVENEDVISRFKRAPAAKSVHHAYAGGMIEHVTSIIGILDGLATHFKGTLDRDLLFVGGLFHDVGKLWELSYEKTTDYTDEGKLIGHLVMGVELIEKAIQELEATPGRLPGPFPREKRLLAKHLVLAHHGRLEYGSPKEPQCLEALVVHMIDDLDSKVNAIKKFIDQDQTPGQWTALNRQFERTFFKGLHTP